jgi:hypothetical protein
MTSDKSKSFAIGAAVIIVVIIIFIAIIGNAISSPTKVEQGTSKMHVVTWAPSAELFSVLANPNSNNVLEGIGEYGEHRLDALVKPVQTAVPVRSGPAARAYHYDPRLATWEADMAAAQSALLISQSPQLQWSEKAAVDENDMSIMLGGSCRGLLRALDMGPPHRVVAVDVERVRTALSQSPVGHAEGKDSSQSISQSISQPKHIEVKFTACIHAPGKSHGMCFRATVVSHIMSVKPASSHSQHPHSPSPSSSSEEDPVIYFTSLDSMGVISEGDLYLLSSSPSH